MTRESSPEIAEKADRRCLDITSSISTHLGCGKSVATLEPYLISVPDFEEPINKYVVKAAQWFLGIASSTSTRWLR